MKLSTTFIKTTLTASALLISLLTHAETTKITVNGMVCAFCAQGIESALKALPETKAVYVDLAGKVVAVESKDGMKLNPAKIKKEIEDAGYDAIKFEPITQTVAQFKAAAKQGGK
jgi:copper chaperone CopZ